MPRPSIHHQVYALIDRASSFFFCFLKEHCSGTTSRPAQTHGRGRKGRTLTVEAVLPPHCPPPISPHTHILSLSLSLSTLPYSSVSTCTRTTSQCRTCACGETDSLQSLSPSQQKAVKQASIAAPRMGCSHGRGATSQPCHPITNATRM